VVELAEIFRRYGLAYRARFGPHMLPSHHEAMRAIEQCRTPALGGQVYECPDCSESRYLYHSCRNRHCPKCQNGNAQEWLAALGRALPAGRQWPQRPKYLAPYIFRVAISSRRILRVEDGRTVTPAGESSGLACDPPQSRSPRAG